MMLSNLFLDIEPFGLESIIKLVIVGLALVLFALSITAYRDIRIKRILFASAAFALFAIQFFVDFIVDYVVFLEEGVTDVLVLVIPLVILVLFFVAVVKQK